MTEEQYRMGIPLNNQNILRSPCIYEDILTFTKKVPELLLCDRRLNTEELLLVLTSLTRYLSREEVNFLCQVNASTTDTAFSALLKRKNHLKKISGKFCGQTRAYYHVTPAGWNEANALMSDSLYIRYVPPKNTNQLIHKYGAGMNVIQMLLAGIPCAWGRELELTKEGATAARKKDEDLWTDMFCFVWPDSSTDKRRIYFEEDTGTESRIELHKKIMNYAACGRMDNKKDILLFSFIKHSVQLEPHEHKIFSQTSILQLKEALNASDCFSLQELITNGLSEDIFNRCKTFIDYIDPKETVPITDTFLSDYIDRLKYLRNPWQLAAINQHYVNLAMTSLRAVLRTIFKTAPQMTEAHKCMLYGSQVLFAATPLVADVIPWSCSDMFPSYQQYIISTLRPLFQDIRYDSILTKEIHSPRGRSYEVAMRNSFKYEKNRVIAVEFPCFDVAAWFRIWHLYQMFKYDSLPISVLCVFDNDTQARSFCDMLGCKIAHINPSMQKEGLYMTFRYLLGQPKKIVSLVPGEDITL